jgi:type VI secretion system VasD/TssJ family lipoprotein
MKTGFVEGVVLTCCLLIVSCASTPAWIYEKDSISLSYKSDSQLNSYQGNPHTIMLCMYQLTDPNAFHQLSDDENGLSKLLACEKFDQSVTSFKKFVVYPASTETEHVDRAEGTRYVGVVAGYYLLHKDKAVRFYSVPLSFLFNKPTPLKIGIFLGSQEIQTLKGE